MAKPEQDQAEPSWAARFFPLLQWEPLHDHDWLRPDLIARFAVAALVVPKALGYAGIAGVPIQYGLYAAAAGAILYAFIGSSPDLNRSQLCASGLSARVGPRSSTPVSSAGPG